MKRNLKKRFVIIFAAIMILLANVFLRADANREEKKRNIIHTNSHGNR